MATIGSVTKRDDGRYEGELRTLSIRAEIAIVPVTDKASPNQPDYRVVSQGIEIADELDSEGISVEVIDIRTLVPLDIETIVTSVKKTARAVVLHEAARRLGYGAEIAAEVQEKCFWHLDQPVVRIAAKNNPIPTSPALEDATIPQPAEIAQTLREVARA